MFKMYFRFSFLLLLMSVTTVGCGQELHSSQTPKQAVRQSVEGVHSSTNPEAWVSGHPISQDNLHRDGSNLKEPNLPSEMKEERSGAVADTTQWVLYETGTASYYSARIHGKKMASGDRYDKNALMCAHKTLPFGTNIRVVNKKNGKEVVVFVKDRGPYGRGRVVDLSNKAAEALDMVRSGVAPVEVWIEKKKH
ncbi:MAG: septal ring lytic transglycosylase RlpA family protein [Bacteroidaceae bacterium]|nr:septal ring lytic transglycosylase RlpA family protein [Bacteroidaceae bacterium]